MTVLLPRIGVSDCSRAIELLKARPTAVVGSFWIMCKYGFDTEDIPGWWSDIVLEENSAQSILDYIDKDYIVRDHKDPLYFGFCILVITNSYNLADFSYMIQHIRMTPFEGIEMLKLMAEHNIRAMTEVLYPDDFLSTRYGDGTPTYKHLRESMNYWSVQVWEDYCSALMAENGQRMLADYYQKIKTSVD